MSKILIVAKAFYPIITPRSFRATELAKELAKQGHEVTVLTPRDEKVHKEFEEKYGLLIKDLGKLKYPIINIDGGKFTSRVKRGVRRALQLAIEYPDIELFFKVKNALKKEQGYDMLVSIAVPYPIHWGVAAAIKNKTRLAKVWVADCGDPYMGDTADSFRKLPYFKYIEKWFFKKVDYATIPLEQAKKGYYPEFHNKMVIIPQGFNFEDVEREEYIPNPVPTFVYAGNFIPGYRDPGPFLEALIKIDKPFKFKIFTESTGMVSKYKEKLGERLEISGFIDRTSLLKELSKSEFVVNISNATTSQSPSKLIDYKLAGRPILNVASGEANEKVIEEFLSGNYSNQFVIENIEDYNIINVANKFVNLIPGN